VSRTGRGKTTGLGQRGDGHEQPPRLPQSLLVRPDETPGEAESRLPPLLGGLATLLYVGIDDQAEGREGCQENQGRQAIAEARESD
jgi:hypothetical protein